MRALQSFGGLAVFLIGLELAVFQAVAAEPMCFSSAAFALPARGGEGDYMMPVGRLFVFAPDGEVKDYLESDAKILREHMTGDDAGQVVVAGIADGELAFSIPFVEEEGGKVRYRFEDDGGSAVVSRSGEGMEMTAEGHFVIRYYDDGSTDIAVDTQSSGRAGPVVLKALPYEACRVLERVYESLILRFGRNPDQ